MNGPKKLLYSQNAGCNVKPRLGNRIEWKISAQEMVDLFDQYDIDPAQLGAKKGGINLCRFEDTGHYEIGNVYFDLHENNISANIPNRRAHGATVYWGNQYS